MDLSPQDRVYYREIGLVVYTFLKLYGSEKCKRKL